jgi:predicted HAD superfamily Cof-like phosphohydrolase
MNHFKDVVAFNEAARGDLPRTPTKLTLDEAKLCLRLIIEESFETVEAMFKAGSPVLALMKSHKDATQYVLKTETTEADLEQNDVELLDGLCDTLVVAMGMAAMAGLPLNEGMAEVNRSNLAKIDPETGRCIKDAGGKIQKPEGWTKPDLASVVAWCHRHGNRDRFFEEPLCVAAEVHHHHKHHHPHEPCEFVMPQLGELQP